MGGTDEPTNLVQVSISKHAELHKQLWEDLGCREDFIAWMALSGQITGAEAKILAIKEARKRDIGKKRKPLSDETKAKISRGRTGKIHSEETRKKMSDYAKTQKQSIERRKNHSEFMIAYRRKSSNRDREFANETK